MATPTVKQIEPGCYAPGYRDPELLLRLDDGRDLNVRLHPQAFVELLNYLGDLQSCIDDQAYTANQVPCDLNRYPYNPAYRCIQRGPKGGDSHSFPTVPATGRLITEDELNQKS